MNKSDIRPQLKQIRVQIADKPGKDKLLLMRLSDFLSGKFPRTESVFIYESFGTEADTRAFIAEKNYRFYFPLVGNDWEMTASGAPAAPPVTIVPLLGFNKSLHRIGYGKGCYDRYFARNPDTAKIGIAYDEQLCDFTPEPHDVALDCIITPTKIFSGFTI